MRRELVYVLRNDPQSSNPGQLPGLVELPALIDRVRESGVDVVYTSDDHLPALTPEAGHAAYRLVQEALTNVIRHAHKADTVVSVSARNNDVVIEVRNRGELTDVAAVAVGHGLAGMHERVHAVGGALTAGPAESGGFTVQAVLSGSTQS